MLRPSGYSRTSQSDDYPGSGQVLLLRKRNFATVACRKKTFYGLVFYRAKEVNVRVPYVTSTTSDDDFENEDEDVDETSLCD